jgi:hypothetical protein
MKRIEIQLKAEERRRLEILSTSGVCQVRELQRAQVLLALDRGILVQQIINYATYLSLSHSVTRHSAVGMLHSL